MKYKRVCLAGSFFLTKVIIYDNIRTVRKGTNLMKKVLESPRLDIVRQLKEVRKAEGMTQEELAELVGTKKSNISRLESGRYNPSLDFLVKVAGGLGKKIQVSVK